MGGHELARDAEAALDAALVEEGLLERAERAPRGQPSTVGTSLPSASTASMRQELTVRPSRRTVQAPHSPTRQHSFVPVRPEVVAQDVQEGVVRGHLERAGADR